MYKNLSEIIRKDSWQKTVIQSRVVFQKYFFLVVNCREHFSRALYFTKVVAVNHSSTDTLFFRRALETINCIYKMNLTVYLRRIFISKEHLQPCIWVAPSFFQEASCSDLVWYCVSFKQALAVIPFFIGIELIHKSSCSHLFDELPFFYYKRVIAATHSFKFTVFLRNRNFSKEILTVIIIPPW